MEELAVQTLLERFTDPQVCFFGSKEGKTFLPPFQTNSAFTIWDNHTQLQIKTKRTILKRQDIENADKHMCVISRKVKSEIKNKQMLKQLYGLGKQIQQENHWDHKDQPRAYGQRKNQTHKEEDDYDEQMYLENDDYDYFHNDYDEDSWEQQESGQEQAFHKQQKLQNQTNIKRNMMKQINKLAQTDPSFLMSQQPSSSQKASHRLFASQRTEKKKKQDQNEAQDDSDWQTQQEQQVEDSQN